MTMVEVQFLLAKITVDFHQRYNLICFAISGPSSDVCFEAWAHMIGSLFAKDVGYTCNFTKSELRSKWFPRNFAK